MSEAQAASLDINQTRAWLYTLREQLPVFVVTDHPTDWPDFYVARLHLSLPTPQPTNLAIMDRDLDRLRETLEALGHTHLSRSPDDDPAILETWI